MLEMDGVADLIQKFSGVLFRHRPFPPDLTRKRIWLYIVDVEGEVGIGSKTGRVIMRCYLTTCCAEKREDEGLLPAKERYQSERVKHVVSESERSNVPQPS